MGWPKGVPRVKKTEAAPEAVPAAAPAPASSVVPLLGDWLADMEQRHISAGVVLVRATHPDATPGIYTGRYSGVHLAVGPVSATYSDGTTI